MKAIAISIVKYAVAALLLALIVRNAETDKIASYFQRISWAHLFLALAFATGAQILSALRMRYFFRESKIILSRRYALILYYVGAFYNFLLPGGIGGDAYKVLVANKQMDVKVKQGIRIMLADRASGLYILLVSGLACLVYLNTDAAILYGNMVLAVAALIITACYLYFCKKLLLQPSRVMLASLTYSVGVQGCWIATLAAIWLSIGHGDHLLAFITLYCAASISGMLPISVGGLGIKEMTYFYGAQLFASVLGLTIDGELGIALSLCLFVIGFVVSLPGLLWLNRVSKIPLQ